MLTTDVLSALAALALVIGLIVLTRFGSRLLPKRRGTAGAAPLWLAGQLGLDGRRRLLLVQCGDGQVLVLTGGTTDVMLPWPPRPVLLPVPEQGS